MYGHGVANRYIEMVNLLALLHQPGRYVLNIIILCLSYNYHQYNTYIISYSYGFVTEKLICLGFISLPGARQEQEAKIVTTDFIMDPKACYEIDIAGIRFPAKPHIHPLPIPVLSSRLNKKYIPIPVVAYQSDVSR